MPTASLVCEGFRGQAATTAAGLGLPGLPTALVPGHVDVQSTEELRHNVAAVTVDAVIRNLTEAPPRAGGAVVEPAPADIVFEGDLDEVNRFFYENDWSDGLPIVPPTPDRVRAFLDFADRPAETDLGVLLPDRRRATIWSVAVNGVMAGCRPEYMPILVALVEAMADPRYGVEHSGNTPGAETLIILNGPLIKELGFNYEQGALRDGIQANTTIGRFWRLYLRNVAGFLHHRTDKGTFGNTWRVVLAENEDALRRIGWTTIAEDEGVTGGQCGHDLALHRRRRHRVGVRQRSGAHAALPGGLRRAEGRLGAHVHGGHGGGEPAAAAAPEPDPRGDARQGRARQGRAQAAPVRAGPHPGQPVRALRRRVDQPRAGASVAGGTGEGGADPAVFAESEDPERLVPIVCRAEDLMIAVSGDPLRTNAYAFAHNGILGYPDHEADPPAHGLGAAAPRGPSPLALRA